MSLRSRLPLLGDASPRGAADVSPGGSPGVPDELTPQVERKGEMSSLESPDFPPPPSMQPADEHEPPAAEPFAAPQLPPPQPFNEMQPLQPLDATPVESYPLQQPESVELQPPLQHAEPVKPLEPAPAIEPLQPLQPTMPPRLPLLTATEPATAAAPPAVATPAPTPEEVANLGVPLGTLIFRAGLLTEEQLEDALQEGVRSGKRLGEVLLEGGLIDERDLGRLLADQKGLRFVELSQLTLDPAATGLLSAEKAHMFAALAVGFEEGVPVVAVADPSNELVVENLRRALGSDPRLVVASRSDLHATIDRVHGTPVEEPVVEPPLAAEPVFVAPPQPEPVAEPVVEPQREPLAVEPAAPAAPDGAFAPEAPAELSPLTPPVQAEPVAAEPVAPTAPEPVAPATPAPVAPEPAPVPEPVAAATPEPVLRPVEVEQVAPLVPESPPAEAVPASSPAEPQPEVLTSEPVVAAAPEQTFSGVEQELESQPEIRAEEELPSAVSYEVSLRLADGERVPIGSFADPQKAREYAREVVRHLSDETSGWPFFSGRFMRPDTILSVDIVPVGESDRWLGSTVRSNWASRLNR